MAACGEPTRTESILDLAGDTTNGGVVYDTYCAICHGVDGEGVEGLGASLQSTVVTDEVSVDTILNGNDLGMTPFADVLTDQEVADVNAFIHTL